MAMDATSRLDEVLKRSVDLGEVPGVVAMAANERGTCYEGAFGRRGLGDDAAMAGDTVFWIASMTKAITTAAALQQVEEGKLQLDEPIAGVLPELSSPQVLEGFAADGTPRLRSARRPITLRHLLTHTAGFGYDIWSPELVRYMEREGIPGIISCRNAALATPLLFDPGEAWAYGINIDWAGKAVEAASGMSLEAYFAERIFEPLGMGDSGFIIRADQRPRLAAMHARKPDGSLEPIPFEVPQDPEFYMGGGGLYSAARDYLRFTQMVLNEGMMGGNRVLRPETVALMRENQIGDLAVGRLVSAMPELSNDADFFPDMVKKFSLGFLINTEDAPTGRSAGSLAWAGLANTYYWIDPKRQVTGVILTQILPFADPKVLALHAAFERTVYEVSDSV